MDANQQGDESVAEWQRIVDEYVQRIVAEAPPLTPRQKRIVTTALRPLATVAA